MFFSILGFLASAYFLGNIMQLHPFLQVVFFFIIMYGTWAGEGALRDQNS